MAVCGFFFGRCGCWIPRKFECDEWVNEGPVMNGLMRVL